MKKLGDILKSGKVSKKLSEEDKRNDKLKEAWLEINGTVCKKHTSNLTLKNGVLRVYMNSQVWRQELLLKNKKEMTEKMAAKTGFTIVDIKIQPGG